ncbi:MAG: hypothetical protein SGPRY_003113 [Prymnesium sp.]
MKLKDVDGGKLDYSNATVVCVEIEERERGHRLYRLASKAEVLKDKYCIGDLRALPNATPLLHGLEGVATSPQ